MIKNYLNIIFTWRNASILSYLLSILFLTVIPGTCVLIEGCGGAPNFALIQVGVGCGFAAIALQLVNYRNSMSDDIKLLGKQKYLRYVGSSDKALIEIQSIVSKYPIVRNTLVGLPDRRLSQIVDIYERWLKTSAALDKSDDERLWDDIASPAQIYSKRYTSIKFQSVKQNFAHRIRVLRHSTPIINFILLEEDSGRRIVYFGWVSNARNPKIFCSTDDQVTLGFYRYFEILSNYRSWGEPIVVDYSARVPAQRIARGDLVDKTGSWLTLSISDGVVATYGFFDIEIETRNVSPTQNGTLKVHGSLYDSRMNFIDDIRHDGGRVTHYQNRILIEYGDITNPARGFCFYEFLKDVGNLNIEASQIRGFYIDEDQEKRNHIVGVKVDTVPDLSNKGELFDAAKHLLENLHLKGRITRDQMNRAHQELDQMSFTV